MIYAKKFILNKQMLGGLFSLKYMYRSKVHENNVSRERALKFDQWTTFPKSHNQISVWLWFVSKITKNNCRSWLFAEFIETQKIYPTHLKK